MSRYDCPTGMAAAGAAAGAILFNIPSGTLSGFVLHRAIPTFRTDTVVAPSNQNIVLGLYRTTARGTPTTTSLWRRKRTWQADTAPIPGVDVAWSVNPTLDVQVGVCAINTAGGIDLPFELDDGIQCSIGEANGLAVVNIQNAIPANHRAMMWFTAET